MIKDLVPILAIVVIGGLEALALSQGINGVLLAGSIAAIAGIGGYKVKSSVDKRKAK